MKPNQKMQFLADFHAEVKAGAYRYALENYVGGKKKIVSEDRITGRYCGALGVRMAKIWGVTRGTANRRLQALADDGVIRSPRYGLNHCDSYNVPENLGIQFVNEAIQHWLSVGYSQTELRDEIKEPACILNQ